MKYFVIIPTYNEKENIRDLILEIKRVFGKSEITGGVVVVDDNSPDKTYEVVEKLKHEISTPSFEVHLILREAKMGLGSAYVSGFKKAISLGADLIQEMDADFSHSPGYLITFFNELKNNDVVIGSRYVEGGDVVNWGLLRKVISKGASIYTKIILGWDIKDPTSGFVGYRRKVIENICMNEIKSNGYVFQIEMKYRAYRLGFMIKEIPIVFPNRILGKSKMSFKIICEAIYKVLGLRFNKNLDT